VSDQPGLVRTAAGGTLFLDEIGDLPLDVQPKLLRFLEQQEIMPIGETKPQKVDVRVLAATNADLEQRVAEGKFREDLYYRLSVIRILVPPLARTARGDSASQHLLPARSVRAAREARHPSELREPGRVLAILVAGNVRQLKNEIQRAVALSAPGGIVEPSHLSPEISHNRLPSMSQRRRHVRPARPRTWHRPSSRSSAT
jgi:transcriptional regulator with PAS, ATPase and Fis domain